MMGFRRKERIDRAETDADADADARKISESRIAYSACGRFGSGRSCCAASLILSEATGATTTTKNDDRVAPPAPAISHPQGGEKADMNGPTGDSGDPPAALHPVALPPSLPPSPTALAWQTSKNVQSE